jgi:hypothetical protein
MFWSMPPECGQRSALQEVVVLPFLSVEVNVMRHCTTSAFAASGSGVVSRGSVPATVLRQSVQAPYEK